MIELIRGLSYVLYTYEGGPLRFTVPFPYLDRRHVQVFVGEPDTARMVAAKWISSTTIEIPSQEGILTVPYTVTLRRTTPIDKPIVDFRNGGSLPAATLNKALLQLLYAQQEGYEGGTSDLPGGPGNVPDIATIIDDVLRSPAMQELLTRNELIDVNAETVLEDILRSDNYNDAHRKTEVHLSKTDEAVAGVLRQVETSADEISANAALRTALAAKFGSTEEGTAVAAAIDEKFSVEASAREALAESVTTLQVSTAPVYFGADAPVAPEGGFAPGSSWIKTGEEGVYTPHNWDGAKWVVADIADLSITAALAQNLTVSKITADQAQTIASTQVQAFKDGDFATIREEFDVVAGEHAGMYGQWQASWSVKINAGTLNGAPVVAGVALSADPETGSAFIVQADKFAIAHPQYTSGGTYLTTKFPFVVGTVGGQSTVGITGALLVDGSITADKITANTLSAITANMGTVNGGTFKTHTLNAQGEVTDELEFRAEFSNVGTWPIWVGSGVKNENNAVFWVDRQGRAGFDGEVKAPNIHGKFQSASAVDWRGAITVPANDWREIHRFTLDPPVLVGEEHAPCVSLTVNHDPVFMAECRLEVLDGSVWREVSSYSNATPIVFDPSITTAYTSDGAHGHTATGTAVYPRSTSATLSGSVGLTAASKTFRIIFHHLGQATADQGTEVTAVTGFAFGIR